MLIKNPCILLFTGNKTIPDGWILRRA
jgi:hypothetical protein